MIDDRKDEIMETYVSCDIEADGPIPGPHSMLSIGAAAFRNGELIDTFEANLEELEGASMSPETKTFWDKNPEAWKACRVDQQDPKNAMIGFYKWVTITSKGTSPVFVAFPLGFDFTFVYWYLMKFVEHSPFSFSGIDMKTFGMFMMNCEYRKVTKKKMPQRWMTADHKHTHKAIDDAIEQGYIFINMLKEYHKFIASL